MTHSSSRRSCSAASRPAPRVEGAGVEKIADADRASALQCDRIGDDLLITARMREW